jgi:hypothetical protein
MFWTDRIRFLYLAFVDSMFSMAEIQTNHIHASQDHLFQNLLRVGRWSESTNNLCMAGVSDKVHGSRHFDVGVSFDTQEGGGSHVVVVGSVPFSLKDLSVNGKNPDLGQILKNANSHKVRKMSTRRYIF